MEAFKYLILIIILTSIIGLGFYTLFKGIKKKDSRLKIMSLTLIGIPTIIVLYGLIPQVLTEKPAKKDLIGIYKIVSIENGILESDFDKHTLNLKMDGTFEFVKTPGINLCEKGNYEIDYGFENNELSFQCGQGWTSAHIKRKIMGFEIEFFSSEREIRYAKIN